MPRTRSVLWSQLKLGIVGIVALALLAVSILAVGGQGGFPWERYPLKTQFDRADGLKSGAVVRLNGKEVGQVTSVEFAGPRLEVALEISKDVRQLVTSDSVASVGSLSLLGEPIIDVNATGTGMPLADWAYIKSGPPGGPFGEITAKASDSMDDVAQLLAGLRAGRGTLGKLVTDEALYTELHQLVATATSVTRGLNEGKGTLGALSRDPAAYNALKTSLENLQTLTARLNAGQGPLGKFLNDEAMGRSLTNTTSNAEQFTANAGQITARLTRGEGTAGKLLTDQELYNHLNSLTNRVDELMAGLGGGRGTAGQLLQDKQLYENMNRAASELRELLADIRKDPKKFLRVSVSIF